ncbi:MAG: hypothetical protein ABIQ89_02285 [Candidatus Saccharimonadales bacterium]
MVTIKKQPPKYLKPLVITTVAVILGVSGWFIWQSQQKNPPQKAASVQKAEKKQLDITSWAVQLTLAHDTPDAAYDNKTASPVALNLTARFLNSETGCTDGAVAVLYRAPKDDPNPLAGGKKYSESEAGTTVGDFFYYVKPATQSCPGNKDSQARLETVRADYLLAATSIKKL